MAVPSSGQLSLYGLAKEKELNNYDNTIPISTYNSFYATPISLGNMATGAGGFDANNYKGYPTLNSTVPHTMSEWYGYDHDAIFNPNYTNLPVNKPNSYMFFPYNEGPYANNASGRRAWQYVRWIGHDDWTVDNSDVYQNAYFEKDQRVSQTIDFVSWYDDFSNVTSYPTFATNAENRVDQAVRGDANKTMQLYIEATNAWRFYDIIVGTVNATLLAGSVTYSDSYIYLSWTNTSSTQFCYVYVQFKFFPNPNITP